MALMPSNPSEAEHELRVIQTKLRELRDKHKRQGSLSPNDLSLANRLAQTERLLLKARQA